VVIGYSLEWQPQFNRFRTPMAVNTKSLKCKAHLSQALRIIDNMKTFQRTMEASASHIKYTSFSVIGKTCPMIFITL